MGERETEAFAWDGDGCLCAFVEVCFGSVAEQSKCGGKRAVPKALLDAMFKWPVVAR